MNITLRKILYRWLCKPVLNRKTPHEILLSQDSTEIHAWHVSATIDELHTYLRGVARHSTLADHARDALDIKLAALARKPHWTTAPMFWVTVLALIFAALAAWPVIRGWTQPAPSAHTDSNYQPQQPNSKPTLPPSSQK